LLAECVGRGYSGKRMARWQERDWLDGHYELLMDFHDGYDWVEAAQALWAQPQLAGVWTGREFDPEVDPRRDPSDILVTTDLLSGHLTGVAHLPGGKNAPCGCAISERQNWLIFFLPIAGLVRCYDLGRYPFGDIGRPWTLEVDRWLAGLAQAVYREVPFRVAAIGSELCTLRMIEEPDPGMLKSRNCGVMLPFGDELLWLPPTGAEEPK
jgi:hypothetical protein